MAGRIKDKKFFLQPAEKLAPQLLGKIICRKIETDNGPFVIRCRINVTEAYCHGDPVTDATTAEKKGEKTSQHNKGGHLYVKQFMQRYHKDGFRIDIVANDEGIGEGVLIRGIDPYEEGPIRPAWALDIDMEFDGEDLRTSKRIWLEDDEAIIIQNEPSKRMNLRKNAPESSKEMLLRFTTKEIKLRCPPISETE